MSYDTIFQAAVKSPPPAEDSESTVFDPAPARRVGRERAAPPAREEALGASATELLIDEPEPASDSHERNPPRPKNRRGGRGAAGGRSVSGILKWLAIAAFAGAAGFALYYFVWPLVGGRAETGATASTPATTSIPSATPPSGSASAATTSPPTTETPTAIPPTAATPATTTAAPSDPRAGAPAAVPPPTTSSVAPRAGAASPPAATPTSKPPDTVPTPSASGAPKPPPTSPPSSAGGDGRALLQSGNLAAAARAFQREISSASADKFTLALGLYCNEENAGRLVASASGSSDIYVLPTSVEGRSCYRVIWGLYDSREAAARGIPSLPRSVRAGDVAPVAVSRFLR
jgi:septal ring-binding cell division protein DamX